MRRRTGASLAAADLAALGLVPAGAAAPGDPDPSFGQGSVTTTNFPGRPARILAIAVQPGGFQGQTNVLVDPQHVQATSAAV